MHGYYIESMNRQIISEEDTFVRTDRTIPNNKPDIIIRDNKQWTCMLIDVAIPGHRNVLKKEAENTLKYKYKYKDLITEIKRMWNFKAKVISAIIRTIGT